MSYKMPTLDHQQQQLAVERIQELMAQGVSSGEAITLVAKQLRAQHNNVVTAKFAEEEESEE